MSHGFGKIAGDVMSVVLFFLGEEGVVRIEQVSRELRRQALGYGNKIREVEHPNENWRIKHYARHKKYLSFERFYLSYRYTNWMMVLYGSCYSHSIALAKLAFSHLETMSLTQVANTLYLLCKNLDHRNLKMEFFRLVMSNLENYLDWINLRNRRAWDLERKMGLIGKAYVGLCKSKNYDMDTDNEVTKIFNLRHFLVALERREEGLYAENTTPSWLVAATCAAGNLPLLEQLKCANLLVTNVYFFDAITPAFSEQSLACYPIFQAFKHNRLSTISKIEKIFDLESRMGEAFCGACAGGHISTIRDLLRRVPTSERTALLSYLNGIAPSLLFNRLSKKNMMSLVQNSRFVEHLFSSCPEVDVSVLIVGNAIISVNKLDYVANTVDQTLDAKRIKDFYTMFFKFYSTHKYPNPKLLKCALQHFQKHFHLFFEPDYDHTKSPPNFILMLDLPFHSLIKTNLLYNFIEGGELESIRLMLLSDFTFHHPTSSEPYVLSVKGFVNVAQTSDFLRHAVSMSEMHVAQFFFDTFGHGHFHSDCQCALNRFLNCHPQ